MWIKKTSAKSSTSSNLSLGRWTGISFIFVLYQLSFTSLTQYSSSRPGLLKVQIFQFAWIAFLSQRHQDIDQNENNFIYFKGIRLTIRSTEKLKLQLKIVKTLIFSYRLEVLEIFGFIFHFPVLFLCTDHNFTIIFIMFWDFLIFYQIFFLPQVKRCAMITDK